MKQAQRFLKKKNQVRVSITMFGRQFNYPERGVAMLEQVTEFLDGYGTPANTPTQKNMSIVFNPKK